MIYDDERQTLVLDLQTALMNTADNLVGDWKAVNYSPADRALDMLTDDMAETLLREMTDTDARRLAFQYIKNSAATAFATLI